jgi:excisionase family DNA binding protein
VTETATVSLTEAAARLGISRAYAYRLAREGRFPVSVLEIGRKKRVSRAQLERFLLSEAS